MDIEHLPLRLCNKNELEGKLVGRSEYRKVDGIEIEKMNVNFQQRRWYFLLGVCFSQLNLGNGQPVDLESFEQIILRT